MRFRITSTFLLLLFAFFGHQNSFGQVTEKRQFDSLQKELAKPIQDSQKVNLLLKIAKTFDADDTTSRLKYAANAMQIARQINWKAGILKTTMLIGNAYGNTDQNRAIPFYHDAVKLGSALKDSADVAEAYNSIAYIYHVKTRFDSALFYYQKSLQFQTVARFKVGLNASIGSVYQTMGDYPRALERLLLALKLNQQVLADEKRNQDDSLTHAGLLVTTGDVYTFMSRYDEAYTNYNEVLHLAHALKDTAYERMFEMLAYSGIAKTFQFKRDFAKASEYYKTALNLSRLTKNHENECSILNDLGNVYLSLGNLTLAMSYAAESERLAYEYKAQFILPRAYTTLGQISLAQKDYRLSVTYLQKAIDISKKNLVMTSERDAWEALSKTYDQMNQPANALNAFRNFIRLRDSVINTEKANQMTRAEMKFNFEKKQQVDSLKQSLAFNMKLQRQRSYTVAGFAGLALVLLLAFFIFRGYSRQKKNNAVIQLAHETIKREKQVSENLILNILPVDVAEELKAHGKVQAKLFDNVTVLFTDFVNFTKIAEHLSPKELVEELDTCFRAFDEIGGRYKIEKIKTVGDAYLAVSGLPIPIEDHALQVAKAATEMRDFMLQRRSVLKDKTFEIRLGIHTGKVVAGIVGMKKFAYDVWGDTVNTAARMEQNSEAGQINISDATYCLIKNDVNCTYRGEVEAKNKGKMKMYFINGEVI